MSGKVLRIGTRESQLAVWQAEKVKSLLRGKGYESELVYIKSEGDVDLQTPLYEIGVQGIFTRSLDIALLTGHIDLAVHSMKDVPTRLPVGIIQAAVLERASYKDLLVYKQHSTLERWELNTSHPGEFVSSSSGIIATSSIRRKAQWLNRYPLHQVENLRGNVNTRMKKVAESNWDGAIFAAAGLERINLRPETSIELDWMLPAPAQGAIVIVGRDDNPFALEAAAKFNHAETDLCTREEKAFLRTLLGGCSTPISALARINGENMTLRGNIFSLNGSHRADVEMTLPLNACAGLGEAAANKLLQNGGGEIADTIRNDR